MAWEAALPSGEPGLVEMEGLLKGLVMDSEGLVLVATDRWELWGLPPAGVHKP